MNDIILTFILLAGGMWLIDLYWHKHIVILPHERVLDASIWSGFYIAVALLFALILGVKHSWEMSGLFLTGYTLEKVLSVDNLLVFSAIFAYFKTPADEQYKILKWGIIGAVVFRLLFTVLGVGSLHLFGGWTELAFAAVIAWSAWAMLKNEEEETDIGDSSVIKFVKKHFPKYGTFASCLIAIELSDVMFAFDSVPTIIAVTKEPVLIYSAMIFAILGLRSLYFLLAAIQERMYYVTKAVVILLFFIAGKLALHATLGIHIAPLISFLIVMGILGIGIVASLVMKK